MLVVATLLKRYKRFLADVILDDQIITVHCPNTGAMTGCAEPGMKVWLSKSNNPKRKYAYTWEFAQTSSGYIIGVHSARANRLVQRAIEKQIITECCHYDQIYSEIPLDSFLPQHQSRSRIDFQLKDIEGNTCFIEVKSVTLLEGEQGFFPDTKSERAVKHLESLIGLVGQGHQAILFFCVQHSGICSVAPADHIYPVYGEALRKAIAEGVKVIAYAAEFTKPLSGSSLSLDDYQICRSVPVLC